MKLVSIVPPTFSIVNVDCALDSLEKLKNKQAERAARFEAASELAESTEEVSLENKLKAAGIVGGGARGGDVLARLRAKRSG